MSREFQSWKEISKKLFNEVIYIQKNNIDILDTVICQQGNYPNEDIWKCFVCFCRCRTKINKFLKKNYRFDICRQLRKAIGRDNVLMFSYLLKSYDFQVSILGYYLLLGPNKRCISFAIQDCNLLDKTSIKKMVYYNDRFFIGFQYIFWLDFVEISYNKLGNLISSKGFIVSLKKWEPKIISKFFYYLYDMKIMHSTKYRTIEFLNAVENFYKMFFIEN